MGAELLLFFNLLVCGLFSCRITIRNMAEVLSHWSEAGAVYSFGFGGMVLDVSSCVVNSWRARASSGSFGVVGAFTECPSHAACICFCFAMAGFCFALRCTLALEMSFVVL